ncbi:MAG: hypothetical protein ACM65L_03570 [Microcoleus sp.]
MADNDQTRAIRYLIKRVGGNYLKVGTQEFGERRGRCIAENQIEVDLPVKGLKIGKIDGDNVIKWDDGTVWIKLE